MWISKPEPVKQCRQPGVWETFRAPVGSVWECPDCGDHWEKRIFDWWEGRTRMEPVDGRTRGGCGSWNCDCGPHEEQRYGILLPDDPVEAPLLCMEHRRHRPCRSCE